MLLPNHASVAERSAVGFAMTIYRRRLAGNFQALTATLERHLEFQPPADDLPPDQVFKEILEY